METQKFRIEIRPSVEKDLRKIDKNYQQQIWDRIERLAINPLPRGCKKLRGSGNYYRIRAGVYRIVYEISTELATVFIQRIKHRKSAYNK